MDAARPTRGERNNNPGNIAFDSRNRWRGQLGIEAPEPPATPRFAVFDCPENGIRAIARILLRYREARHLDTLAGLIGRWAPAAENDTAAYVEDVARRLGIAADAPLDLADSALLQELVAAIIRHENGRCIYPSATLAEGVGRAFETA